DPAAGFPGLRWAGENPKPIYFAKSFAYPLAAAPFVRVFGRGGLRLTNALALGLALWFGYTEVRRRASPLAALAATLALFAFTVTPVYALWLTPEMFNLGLVAAGLAAWRSHRPLLSAVLLGIATYSKPYNLFLAIPLGLAPFVPLLSRAAREAGARWGAALGESARAGARLAGTTALLFAANKAVTGELNYHGRQP